MQVSAERLAAVDQAIVGAAWLVLSGGDQADFVMLRWVPDVEWTQKQAAAAELVLADRRGLRLLYVTLTRATQRLQVVHAAPLPEALAPLPGERPVYYPLNDQTDEVTAP